MLIAAIAAAVELGHKIDIVVGVPTGALYATTPATSKAGANKPEDFLKSMKIDKGEHQVSVRFPFLYAAAALNDKQFYTSSVCCPVSVEAFNEGRVLTMSSKKTGKKMRFILNIGEPGHDLRISKNYVGVTLSVLGIPQGAGSFLNSKEMKKEHLFR